jgi:hypothetical protein
VKIRATTMLRYKGSQGEALVATRLEIAWDGLAWTDMTGLRSYESDEWNIMLMVMALGARAAQVGFEHRDLEIRTC